MCSGYLISAADTCFRQRGVGCFVLSLSAFINYFFGAICQTGKLAELGIGRLPGLPGVPAKVCWDCPDPYRISGDLVRDAKDFATA